MGFLSPSDATELLDYVSSTTLTRGHTLQRSGQVLQCIVHEDEDTVGTQVLRFWDLEGLVQGSQRHPYAVVARLEFGPDEGELFFFTGRCSCPVGVDCKHAVALALQAGVQQEQWQDDASAPAPSTQDRSGRVTMQRVQQWLESLESMDRKSSPAPDAWQGQNVYLLRTVAPRAGTLPGLELSWQISRPLKRGGCSKPTSPSYGVEQGVDEASPDGQAIHLVRSLSDQRSGYVSGLWRSVRGSLGVLALQACAATGRLYWLDAQGTITGEPLRWAPEQALDWAWQSVPVPMGQEPLWQLEPRLPSTTATLYACPPLVLSVDLALHTCTSVHAPQIEAARLPWLLAAPPLPASAFAAASPRLLRELAPLPRPPGVPALERWPQASPVPHLALTLVPLAERAQHGLVRATLEFDYAGLRGLWPADEAVVLAQHASAGQVLLTRDLGQEASAEARLAGLGLEESGRGRFYQQHPAVWLEWAAQAWAPLREAGFELQLDPGLEALVHTVDDLHVGMAASGPGEQEEGGSGSAWFDLSLGIDLGGERIDVLPWLPEWLAQVEHTPEGPQLPRWLWREQPDGRWLRLPSAALQPWLRALLELVGEREVGSGRLSRLEALRLAASLGEGVVWEGAAHLRAMLGQLTGAGTLPPVPVPVGLQAELRPYQQHGLAWLQFLRTHHLGGVLADDMGLGKTLQTLAHLLRDKEDGRMVLPCLIIAPVSLLGNWRSEAARFAPGLRTRVWHGADRHDSGFAQDCDVLIAPYSLLQRDRERWLGQRWHAVVLDEAQNIKNATTHAAQVVAELDAGQRIALSGTPLENHLGELWSLFHFVMPGFLGSAKRFGTLFRIPIEKHADTTALHRLRQRVTPFILRRTKTAVAAELPALSESVLRVALPHKQADLYETIRLTTAKAVRDALDARGLARSHIQVLDALLKLRQVCCDPHLLKTEAAQKCKTSAKLDLLMEMLPPLIEEGRRVLLFSQFTSMLTLIEERLQAAGLRWSKLTGQTQKRTEAIERFTSGAVPLFLISLKAGGTGLNLQQADTVIHYDPWWNPAVEAQATGRAHRIGQTRQVMVYKLVAEGTIEERILDLQARKAALAEGLLTGAAAREQPLFTESDVAELLRPLGG